MAVTPYMFTLIKRIATRQTQNPKRALAAGYPDFLITEQILKKHVPGQIPMREDSAKIIKWHKANWLQGIPDAEKLMAALGYSLTVIDLEQHRGNEIICDLNDPQPQLERQVDLVIDCGTCEHVFNAGQAMMTLAGALAVGGSIVQVMPMSVPNHGLWNASPTLLWDFYDQNNFKIEEVRGITGPVYMQRLFEMSAFGRVPLPPSDCWLMLLATRQDEEPIKIPQQRKYMAMGQDMARVEAEVKERHAPVKPDVAPA